MNSESSSNIFEEASKKLGKKKKKENKLYSKISKRAFPLPAEVAIDDKEMQEIMKRVREMDEDLQKKIDRICELSGMTRKEVTNFLENPSNFHPEQWKVMQLQREQFEKQFYSIMGVELKKKKNIKKKFTKERHGKTLGLRKGWINMH
jgi:Glu-tRNA(Gln) amidotransferase subunit E-like FAD-binding protein